MFNIARIPKPRCDVISDPAPSPASRKIYVVIHNYFYAITVYTPPSPASAMQLLNVLDIERQLRAVVLDVEQRLAKGETAVPIGVLSADDRDNWAKVHLGP